MTEAWFEKRGSNGKDIGQHIDETYVNRSQQGNESSMHQSIAEGCTFPLFLCHTYRLMILLHDKDRVALSQKVMYMLYLQSSLPYTRFHALGIVHLRVTIGQCRKV